MISVQAQRDPSPLSSPARGEEGFDSVKNPAMAVPGAAIEDEAQTPEPPSPLAGEGKGEGSRNSLHGKLQSFAKAMRKEPTDAERALWRIVRGKRLEGFKFRRQQPLGRYIVDIVCLERRLVVEADGGQHHENTDDAARDAWLAGEGFRVLRFWNHEILRTPQMIEDTILRDLLSGVALTDADGNPTTTWEVKR